MLIPLFVWHLEVQPLFQVFACQLQTGLFSGLAKEFGGSFLLQCRLLLGLRAGKNWGILVSQLSGLP